MNGRAQSEILGYVIVFSIIAASVGFIYVTGLPALENSQEAMATNNVESAFDVMDDNIRDITQEGAPSRATEVRIAGGRLFVGEPTEIRFYAENTTEEDDNITVVADTYPVIYRDDADRRVSYVAGAIIRGNGTASAMVSQPDWRFTDRRTIVPIQVLTPRGGLQGISGDTTILLVTKLQVRAYTQSLAQTDGAEAEVNVSVKTDRPGAWEQYFSEANSTVDGGIEVVSKPSERLVYWRFETGELHSTRKAISLGINR